MFLITCLNFLHGSILVFTYPMQIALLTTLWLVCCCQINTCVEKKISAFVMQSSTVQHCLVAVWLFSYHACNPVISVTTPPSRKRNPTDAHIDDIWVVLHINFSASRIQGFFSCGCALAKMLPPFHIMPTNTCGSHVTTQRWSQCLNTWNSLWTYLF